MGGEQLEGQGLVKDAGVVGLVGGVGGLALIEGIRVGLDQLGAAVFYDAPRHLHGQGVGVLPLVQDGHGLGKGEVALRGVHVVDGQAVSLVGHRLVAQTDAMAESPNSGKYNVICSQTGEYTRAKGMEVMESFLKSDGDKIDILFSCNGDMALGAIQAIEAAGLKPGEDIVIVSIDAAKGEFNAMIEGKMNCAVEHTPNFGETLMETAKKIVAGEEVPATIELEEGIFPADIAEQELPNRTY